MSSWPCDRAAQEEKLPLQCPPLVLPDAAVAQRDRLPRKEVPGGQATSQQEPSCVQPGGVQGSAVGQEPLEGRAL